MSLDRTRAGVIGTVGLVLAATTITPGVFRSGAVAQGFVTGVASGLLAVGLVLLYRTTRVVHLGYQAMGACAAQIGVTTYLHFGWPWPMAIVVALVLGAGTGWVTDRLMRRFERAPRLVVTVATIGLLQVFTAAQVMIPYLLGGNTLVVAFPTGLSDFSFLIGTNPFLGDDLLAIAIVPVALAALSWFLFRTDAGIAVRGIAENGDRAQMLGIPTQRLTQLVWIIAGVLAAAVAVLAAPRTGIPANPFVSAGGLFLPALAAAVVARLESLPVAFTTAVALNVADWVLKDNIDKQSIGTVAFLAVILVALLTQRRSGSRASAAEDASWSLSPPNRPLPAEIAALPEVRFGRTALVGVVGAIALALPLLLSPSRTFTYSGYLLLGVVVLSVVVLSGWTGTISLGQYAIVGVGAVVGANLIAKSNADLFLTLAAAGAAGAFVGLLLGAPALRIRPLYVMVSSLAFAAAMDQFFLNPVNYPDAIPAQIIRPVLWKRYDLGSERATYYLCLALLVVTMLVVKALRSGRPGRVTLATRDNPTASAAMGLHVTRIRIVAMMIAGALAGFAGALTAVLGRGVGGSAFPVQTSVLVFSMAVVGGLSSMSGALAGVVVTQGLLTLVKALFPDIAGVSALATGALLLAVLIALPGGIDTGITRLRDIVVSRFAARRGLSFEVGAAAGSYDVDPDEATPPRTIEPDTADSILSCRDLTASYGSLQVLFGVDLDVAEGEIVALLGTNGAGKSTVLKALVGLMANVGGTTRYDGADISGLRTDQIATRGIAMMPGGRGVFPTLTVEENLRLASWQHRHGRAEVEADRAQALELFPILADRAGQPAGNLSGGEQQQLSLAMALLTRPRVLFIDELSLGLAPAVVGMLCEKVRAINADGTTIVVVEQSVNVALTVADRAVFLEKGRVRFEGPTAELLQRPDLLRSVFIGTAHHADTDTAADADVGAGLTPSRGVELACHGLRKQFGGITAVDGIDLTIPPDRIVGLIGHNGAGKTTLFDLLSGFLTADAGTIQIDGVDITDLPPHRRVVAGLGRSFQEARMYPSLTVTDTVMVALDRHLPNRDTTAAALALPAALNAQAAAHERALELLELLGLIGYAETPVSDLSTGTRRILELACVLALDPAIILLDEPSAGVAQKDTEALGPLLRRVRAETGSAIVIIEHDMALLSSLCDEFVALELGTVITSGTPDEVLAHPRVIASYLGTDDAAIQRSGNAADRTTDRGSNGHGPRDLPHRPLRADRSTAPATTSP